MERPEYPEWSDIRADSNPKPVELQLSHLSKLLGVYMYVTTDPETRQACLRIIGELESKR